MGNSFNFYTILTLIGCLLLGLLFAYVAYRKMAHLEPKLRLFLASLRAFVVAVIAGLLFFPLVKNLSYQLEKPVIIIAQDNSLSVGHVQPAGFNKRQYEADLQKLRDQLSAKYELKVYHFSDSIETGFDFSNQGKLSNATALFNRLNDEYLNRNVGAVIMASDGIFNRGGSPLYDLNRLKAPVYTIALGDTIPKRDLRLANVNHNNLVYLNNDFTIEVQLEAFESKGGQAKLKVFENGKQVAEQAVPVNSNAFAATIPVKLKAKTLGLQKYTVQLVPLANEVSEKNNTQHVFIEVIDARQKVLIAAGGPHPDISVIKQALSTNKNYDLKVVTGEDLNALNLNDYGLLIVYQLPDMQRTGAAFMGKLAQVNVPVWYVVGAQTDISRFNALQKLVSINGANSTIQEAFPMVNTDFTTFDIDPAAVKIINDFDPLLAPFGKVLVNGAGFVALKQRIGKIKTDAPQLFFVNDNGRKSGYLIGEGLWRWKLSEAKDGLSNPVLNDLISKTVQYLAVKDDKRKFKVVPSKNTFEENENVLINAVLYNDSYVAVNTPDVSLQLKNEAGKLYNFLFSRTAATYQLDAGMLPAGNYTYTASTTLGDKKYQAKGAFFVNAMIAEYQQTIANHQLLHNMALQTNGKLYMPANLLKIQEDIEKNESIKTLSYEDLKYEELINFKWLFAMIILLLSLEWFFRKRNGEI
ncbi:hypothetical protein OQX61_05915 [Pedobacter sp. PLR]|uniref:hypothetical protein n=1 Tax=Pedobacter sp. PLR TaxID=2994465 RepID=UPI002245F3C6|nr:hypothetical protein [Pedobacter sp. PLR]MCX2450807.1 hypothetical protein [Pedobacter sp. PLR]